MVSDQYILEVIEKSRAISGLDVKVYMTDGTMVGQDGIRYYNKVRELTEALKEGGEGISIGGFLYLSVCCEGQFTYIVEVPEGDHAMLTGRFTVTELEFLLTAYQDRFDKDSFIKNLLLDNLLIVDIYNRAKQIRIDTRAYRIAFIVETPESGNVAVLELLKKKFGAEPRDFVTAVDENDIVLVKELRGNEEAAELRAFAEEIAEAAQAVVAGRIRVAYGNVVDEIRKVSASYKEARLALAVGAIFNADERVLAYASLGIGRLIYQLPLPMCKMFIEEIFKEQSPEDFDEETLTTINQFFENNLNVSETSRQLFIHRNTLVYRLDKLQKNTGLDLRVFDDAITFKIALMVVQYMRYMESQE